MLPTKKIIYLLLSITFSYNGFSQTFLKEGIEIPYNKCDKYPHIIGKIDESFYAVSYLTSRRDIKFNFIKSSVGDLSLQKNEEITINDFKTYIYTETQTGAPDSKICKNYTYVKNKKIYIFYSLYDFSEDAFHIFMKVFDPNFVLLNTSETGTISTKESSKGDFKIEFSPNEKTALVVLTKYKLNTSNTYREFFETTEIVKIDLDTYNKVWTKKIPSETGEFRINTGHYRIDNDGNSYFSARFLKIKSKNFMAATTPVSSIAIGNIADKITEPKLKVVSMASSTVVTENIFQLKSGDIIYIANFNDKFHLEYLSGTDPSKNSETTIKKDEDELAPRRPMSLTEIGDGYIVLFNPIYEDVSDYIPAKFDKSLNLKWIKKFPFNPNYATVEFTFKINPFSGYYSVFEKDNILYLFCLENKPTEKKSLLRDAENHDQRRADHLDFHQTSLITVTSDGQMEKKTIFSNTKDAFVVPYKEDVFLDNEIILNLNTPKTAKFVLYKIK